MGGCSIASADPAETRANSHYHDLVIDSFYRAGFDTSSLAQTLQVERQMNSNNYHDLIDDSFRRAGMGATVAPSTCSKADASNVASVSHCN